jgi:hypothetical protein
VLGPRSTVLNEERKQIATELKVEPASNEIVALHPAILARYEGQFATLQDALSKGINAGDSDAAEAIRDLVETVTVFRGPARPGGVVVEISGRLNALLGENAYPNKVRGVWGKVVAGERFIRLPPRSRPFHRPPRRWLRQPGDWRATPTTTQASASSLLAHEYTSWSGRSAQHPLATPCWPTDIRSPLPSEVHRPSVPNVSIKRKDQ